MSNTIKPKVSTPKTTTTSTAKTTPKANKPATGTGQTSTQKTPTDKFTKSPTETGSSASHADNIAKNFSTTPSEKRPDPVDTNIAGKDSNTVIGAASYTDEIPGNAAKILKERAAGATPTTGGTPTAGGQTETPTKAAGDTPEVPAKQPTTQTPAETVNRPTPRSQDMTDYVDAVNKHNESLPEGARPKPETASRPTPRSQDMTDYVDAVNKHQDELRAGAGSADDAARTAAGGADDAARAAAGTADDAARAAAGTADDAARAAAAAGTPASKALDITARGINGVVGPISTVAGIAETVGGIADVANGNVGSGALRATAGAASTVSGAASTVSAVTTGSLASAAGTLATRAGGIGAIADGAKDMFTSEDPYTRGLGAAKTAAGAAMMSGFPPAVIGGAVTYIGASLAGTETGRKVMEAVGADKAVTWVGDRVGEATTAVTDAAKGAWNWATSWF